MIGSMRWREGMTTCDGAMVITVDSNGWPYEVVFNGEIMFVCEPGKTPEDYQTEDEWSDDFGRTRYDMTGVEPHRTNATPGAYADDAHVLAARIESAIARLDAKHRDSDAWRLLVEEWRDCTARHGPGSASALGCLLALVRDAWGCCVDIEEFYSSIGLHQFAVRCTDGDATVERCGGTLASALVAALEAAP